MGKGGAWGHVICNLCCQPLPHLPAFCSSRVVPTGFVATYMTRKRTINLSSDCAYRSGTDYHFCGTRADPNLQLVAWSGFTPVDTNPGVHTWVCSTACCAVGAAGRARGLGPRGGGGGVVGEWGIS